MPDKNSIDDVIRKYSEQQKRTNSSEEAVDWDERREWWLKRLSSLHNDIRNWFRPLSDEGVVTISAKDVPVYEQYLGPYMAQQLTLSISNWKFDIIPVASLIVGGFGRVDLRGRAGEISAVLTSIDDELPMPQRRDSSLWFLMNRTQRTKLRPLSEEAFKQVFADLMGMSQ